jgi:hypothetical protein
MMNAELTAENRPACVPPGSTPRKEYEHSMTYEDEGRVQVLVILSRVISIKLFRFPPINGEEVGPRVASPEWVEKLLEGGMEAE